MKLFLANPAGLWALLAIPAILLIHFLQERTKRIRASTLFLLERVKPQSIGGARIERLRNSVPLWMQLLAALIIAWLLSDPRWIRRDSRQTVAVVLDSSVSMGAFQKETREMLAQKLTRWSRTAAQTDWHLIESAPRKPTLYAGTELKGLMDAFDKWEPSLGTHRPDDALMTARGLVRHGAGMVIFVTDRKTEVPAEVAVLSAGSLIGNVGFAGGEVKVVGGGSRWTVLVKNYGIEKQERDWFFEGEKADEKIESGRQHLVIEPGQTVVLEGEWPRDQKRLTFKLAGDRFAWDDKLPLQKPEPRIVRVAATLAGATGNLLKKMFAAIDGVELNSLTPDLIVGELGTAVDTHAVQVAGSAGEGAPLDPAWVAAEDHAMTRDLAWSGLLCGKPMSLVLTAEDEPLLWKGGRILALLRHGTTAEGRPLRRLILNWDLTQSNASRTPALLVMLQRFVESVRVSKRDPWAENFETGQELDFQGENTQLRIDGASQPFNGRAPERPGFFEVQEGDKNMISGAAFFADIREADFHGAEPLDTLEQKRLESALRQSEADPLMLLWMSLVLACFMISWAWKQKFGRLKTAKG